MASSVTKIHQALAGLGFLTSDFAQRLIYNTGKNAIIIDAGAKALKYSGIPHLAQALPYGAVVYGGLGVVHELFSIYLMYTFERPPSLKEMGLLIVDGILDYQIYAKGMDALYSAGSLLAVYNCLALQAAISCVSELYKLSSESLDSFEHKNTCIRALMHAAQAIGWGLLSVGNPTGAAFLAMSSVVACGIVHKPKQDPKNGSANADTAADTAVVDTWALRQHEENRRWLDRQLEQIEQIKQINLSYSAAIQRRAAQFRQQIYPTSGSAALTHTTQFAFQVEFPERGYGVAAAGVVYPLDRRY